MATYTITTTAVQEAALAAVLAEVNAGIDAQNAAITAQNAVIAAQNPPGTPLPLLPHLDKPTHLANVVAGVHTTWGLSHQQQIAQTCLTAFASASSANQSQVLSILGMSAYAALPQPQLMQVMADIGLKNFLALTPDKQNQAFALVGLTA